MLAEHDGPTLPSLTASQLEAADDEPADRSMTILQWLIAIVAGAAAIILASVR